MRRAVLVTVEQALLPYDSGVPVTVPDGHSGVALVFGDARDEPSSQGAVIRLGAVATHAGLSDEAVAQEVKAACANSPSATLILSPALAERIPAASGVDRLRLLQPGRPFTGVWWELATELAVANDAPRRVLLADYDPLQSCLCLAEFDIGAVAPSTPDHVNWWSMTRNAASPARATAARNPSGAATSVTRYDAGDPSASISTVNGHVP